MSEIASSERASAEPEKPAVTAEDEVQLPPFPDPTDLDFDDITEEEQNHYKNKFPDLGIISTMRLHCTACDRHLGCSPLNESRMRTHPMLRTLICQTCHSFYNSGEFDRGEDGSELYCRWCGQGGQVYCCSDCIHVFCAKCIKRNLGLPKIKEIENTDDWKCFKCNPNCLWDLRALCWALLRYCDLRNKLIEQTEDADLKQKYSKVLAIDESECCKNKTRRSLKIDSAKKKEKEAEKEKEAVAKKLISKIPPTIQVKKFASVNIDNLTKPKIERKAQKRPASPKAKPILMKNPISIAPCALSGGVNKKFRDNYSSNIIYEVEHSGQNEISRKKLGRPLGSKNKKQKNKAFGKQRSLKRGRPLGSKNKGIKMHHHAELHSFHEVAFPKKKGRPRGSKNKDCKTQSYTEALFNSEASLISGGSDLEQESLPKFITIDIDMSNLAKPRFTANDNGGPIVPEINIHKMRESPSKRKLGRPLKRKRGRPKKCNLTRLTSEEQLQEFQGSFNKSINMEGAADNRLLMTSPNILNPMRFPMEPMKKVPVARSNRPRIMGNNFNGFGHRLYNPLNNVNLNMNNMNLNMGMINDNINLSLDSLTQGLDFAAVQAMTNSNNQFGNNNDVVCTPDFPLEPLCEVTEDIDDDVECITPGPPAPTKPPPKSHNPPPLVPRSAPLSATPAPAPAPAPASKDNIIQMTDSDVTVNSLTGGLKFRVDPQTLSSNKMYRLPDGRIFAINANPNMPGGYSATIVSQNVDGTPKVTPRSETFAAKLSAVPHSSPKPRSRSGPASKRKNAPKAKPTKSRDTYISRETDVKVPVEWYRYNMVDAVDALEYSLSRLHKLKKETSTVLLRSRTVDEMRYLHRTLEQMLTTSSKRFLEIRDTLNKEMKLYLAHKESAQHSSEDDDDDVEILPNTENEDPIFIDENSVESVTGNDQQEVDLTEAASSLNDSAEIRNDIDPVGSVVNTNEDSNNSANVMNHFDAESKNDNGASDTAKEHLLGNHDDSDKMETDEVTDTSRVDASEANSESKLLLGSELNGDEKTDVKNDDKTEDDGTDDDESDKPDVKPEDKSDSAQRNDDDEVNTNIQHIGDKVVGAEESSDDDVGDKKSTDANVVDAKYSDKNVDPDTDRDAEMAEELIENLLKDDNLDENASMEMADLQEAEEILS